MVDYQIVVVEDNELPGATGWVVARLAAAAYLIVTESAYASGALASAHNAIVAAGDCAPTLLAAG